MPLLRAILILAVLQLTVSAASAQQVQVEEFTLDNGMKFLLVPRADQPNSIAAGWVAKVGSVNERPGITESLRRQLEVSHAITSRHRHDCIADCDACSVVPGIRHRVYQ